MCAYMCVTKGEGRVGGRGGAYAIPDKQPVIPGIPEGPARGPRRLDANLRLGNWPTRRCLTTRRGVTSKH